MANICVSLFFYIIKIIIAILLYINILPLIPNIPPNFKFSSFSCSDPLPLNGKLAVNTLLNNADRLFENEIKGPEAFAIVNGELYTSLHGGYIAKIVGDQIRPVHKFGRPCEDWTEEQKCGRPLGLFGVGSILYVADAYYGVFTYDVETGQTYKLFGTETTIEGRKPKLFNSITVAKDGTIYWTDSSSDITLQDGLFGMLADGTGRLIKYDPRSQAHTVLIDGLLFANGVALSADESFLVVAETGMSRLHRFWLNGSKRGTSDLFADALPGMPDNVRSGRQGFLVSLILSRDPSNPMILQSIFPFPTLRKAIARSLGLMELAFQKIDQLYPNSISQRAVHFIGHFEMAKILIPPHVILIALDTGGEVVDSFHATDGKVSSISDAIFYRGKIYLGSPYNLYLGAVSTPGTVLKFQDAFPTVPQISARLRMEATTELPSTTTSRPKAATTTSPHKPTTTTTTTPKPTTTTTPKPTTTTTPKPSTTNTPKPTTTTTTPKPTSTTTTPKPTTTTTTTTPKPTSTTTTAKPTTTTTTTTTPKPSTQKATTPKPTSTTTQKPTTSTTTQKPTTTTTTQKPPTTKTTSSNQRASNEL